jgi:hypothetical protein
MASDRPLVSGLIDCGEGHWLLIHSQKVPKQELVRAQDIAFHHGSCVFFFFTEGCLYPSVVKDSDSCRVFLIQYWYVSEGEVQTR